jgi:hypothetical protein
MTDKIEPSDRGALLAEHEAFEAWAGPEGFDITREQDGETYRSLPTHQLWCGWEERARRASPPAAPTVQEPVMRNIPDAALEGWVAKPFPAAPTPVQEPVAWTNEKELARVLSPGYACAFWKERNDFSTIPLYASPPPPSQAVPQGEASETVTMSLAVAKMIMGALQEEAAAYDDPIAHVIEARDAMRAALAAPSQAFPPTIDMVLFCPKCEVQHVDSPEKPISEYDDIPEWTNPPHRSHLCHGCGHIWRPADVPTNGIAAVKTKGSADSKLASPPTEVPSPDDHPAFRVWLETEAENFDKAMRADVRSSLQNAWIAGHNEAVDERIALTRVMQMALEALKTSGQVIAWHLHGECRAYRNTAIPSAADVRASIDAVIAALQQALTAGADHG